MAARSTRLSSNLGFGLGLAVVLALLVAGVLVAALLSARATTATPAPAPGVTPATVSDGAAFRADADRQLDDMDRDLDDLVTTVRQDGFFRLYSNSVELSFNLAQLRGIAAPAAVAGTWPAALSGIDTALHGLSAAIGTRDGDAILSAVDGVRGAVDTARGVAQRAD